MLYVMMNYRSGFVGVDLAFDAGGGGATAISVSRRKAAASSGGTGLM
jgi:hypothetical protein